MSAQQRLYMLLKKGMNKYADPIKVLKGIFMGPLTITTRLHEWVISAIQEPAANDETTTATPTIEPVATCSTFEDTQAVNDGAPWSCVNKCKDGVNFNNDYEEYVASMPTPIPIGAT